MTPWKKHARAHGGTAGVGDPASKDRLSEITSGSCRGQQGLVNLQGLSKRGQKPKEERAQRERRMSQYERRQRSNFLSGDGSRLPNGGNTRVGQRGSGHLAAFSVCLGGRLDKAGTHANDGSREARLWANQAWQGGTRTSV